LEVRGFEWPSRLQLKSCGTIEARESQTELDP
jgi:hypothetical protein